MVKVSRTRAAELREEIFDATASELLRVGYDAVALTGVAERCHVATSAIYNRFPGKSELVVALVEERLDRKGGPAAGGSPDPPSVDPTTASDRATAFDDTFPEVMFELMLASRHVPELQSVVSDAVQRRDDQARASVPAGIARAGQDPRALVLLGPAASAGSYLLRLVSRPPPSGWDTLDHLVTLATRRGPWDTPGPRKRAARRRQIPRGAEPAGHPVDEVGDALVRSAADVFAAKGYEDATVADIARRAGLTTGAMYNRFRGKANLLTEVVLQLTWPQAHDDLLRATDIVLNGSPMASGKALAARLENGPNAPTAKDRALRLEARAAARREPEVAEVLLPLQERTLVAVASAIRAAQADGTVREDVDAEALAWWLAAFPLGLPLLEARLAQPPPDWAPTFGAIIQALQTRPATD